MFYNLFEFVLNFFRLSRAVAHGRTSQSDLLQVHTRHLQSCSRKQARHYFNELHLKLYTGDQKVSFEF